MRTFLITILFICAFGVNAQDYIFDHESSGRIISFEEPTVDGAIDIAVEFDFVCEVYFSAEPVFTIPTGWTVAGLTSISGTTYNEGDVFTYNFTITYPVANTPFYPEKIKVTFPSSMEEDITASARLYFTPYNTIEVWSLEDFYNLPRRWLDPAADPNPSKIYVNRIRRTGRCTRYEQRTQRGV